MISGVPLTFTSKPDTNLLASGIGDVWSGFRRNRATTLPSPSRTFSMNTPFFERRYCVISRYRNWMANSHGFALQFRTFHSGFVLGSRWAPGSAPSL